jgi:levanase/fructan beta-fructosidase
MKWALLGGDGSYMLGDFDGKHFTPESGKKVLDYGQNFYAAQTWSNAPDGKRIQIAWMRESKYPGMPFTGQMSFPTELSLKSTPDGPRIFRTPVSEISSLYGKKMDKTDKNIIPGLKNYNLLKGIHNECVRITGVFDVKSSNMFGITVRKSRKEAGTEISYDVKKQLLTCIGSQMPLAPVNNKIKLDILVDRASIEIFANNGEKVITDNFTPAEQADDMELWTHGGELMVDSLEVHEIKSIWRE